MTNGTLQPLERLQRLFRDMFRSDRSDLNFGIYRIMNHRRDAVEEFIRETLPKSIMSELKNEYLQKEQASYSLREVARRVKDTLGPDAIGSDGELQARFRDTPLGSEYQEAKRLAADMGDPADVEADVYNHLYRFFSRYYQCGDFISRRRYSSGRYRYAIPYNGEEVYLHWANSDQYYVKTAEFFRHYDWESPAGMQVRFEIHRADTEHNNIKAAKRLFLPLVDQVLCDAKAMSAVIPFEYRPLTSHEAEKYGGSNQQANIVSAAVNDISGKRAKPAPDLAAALRSERGRNGDGFANNLEQHLERYTRRNAFDFFIHKDLKGFLSRELDFYLKSEVLNLDHMDRAGESNASGWFQKMRLVKSVGGDIIDFLAQVEDFQKLLWEKRKFVVETHYCVSVGSINPRHYPAIVDNKGQWREWRRLLGIGNIDKNISFVKEHPTLMIDTRHFDQEFTDGLLADFDDLNEVTDGLLVHGENWHALRLIHETYRETVSLVYVDPTYNTGKDDFLYKDNYQHSTWLSMMDNLMPFWLSILIDRGSFVSHIDEHEFHRLSELIDMRFGPKQNVGPIIWDKRNPKGDATAIAAQHEYLCWAVKDYEALKRDGQGLYRKKPNAHTITAKAREIIQSHNGMSEARDAFKKWIKRQKFSSGEKAYNNLDDDGLVYRPVSMAWPNKKKAPAEYFQPLVHPVTGKPCPVPARGWRNPPDTMSTLLKQGKILFGRDETTQPTRKYLLQDHLVENVPSLYDFGGSDDDLQKRFGYSFPTAKPLRIGEYVASIAAADAGAIVLDCFAGSGTVGHAVINLNREDGGRRKFVLVEMGEYFNTVLLPRIKKAAYAPKWKNGTSEREATDVEAERGPRVIKHMRLESYEDALDNIEFTGGTQTTLEGNYLLKYMLRWETRGSATLLNVEKLTKPFSYALRIRADGRTRTKTVDIPETFNYMLGLNVRSRKAYDDNGRRYLVYRGETRNRPGRVVAVIWRETAGWGRADFERDRAFVKKHGLTAGSGATYVSGGSLIPGARPVEGLFRARMFAETERDA